MITPVRPAARVEGLRAYATPKSPWPIDLRLDANEGAPSDDALRAIEGVTAEEVRRYHHAATLEAEIAQRWGVDAERVVVTAGGDDAIDRLCRALLEPGRTALLHDPTFVMIEHHARLAGADITSVPWRDGGFPTDAFIDRIDDSTAMVALVTPNNPTGLAIPLAEIRRVIEACAERGTVVMVDLAYAEFMDDDPTLELLDAANTVLVRTFSKAHGLAGLRVGYAIAPPEIAAWMRAAGSPYPVSAPSLAAASASLREPERLGARVDRAQTERATLESLLTELGAEVQASQANFVCARFRDTPCTSAAFVRTALALQGIGVRGYPPGSPLEDTLRITLPADKVGSDRLFAALRLALAPEAILLDMDGVIADVSDSYREAIRATCASFGVDVTPEEIATAKRAGDANNDWALTRTLLASAGIAVEQSDVTARFQRVYLGEGGAPGLRERESLIPERTLLERLSAARPVAIVTGRPRDEAAWFLDRFGLTPLVRTVVAMEDAPAKPDPAPVLLAMERLGVSAAWMVGDTVDDIRAARAARAASVLGIAVPAPGEENDNDTLRALADSGAAATIRTLDPLLEALS